jgi:hypothetical protein
MKTVRFLLAVLVGVLLLSGCDLSSGVDQSPGQNITDDDSVQDDDSDTLGDDDAAPQCPGVVWDYRVVDSVAAPDNPITQAQTPTQYNRVSYYRFRPDTGAAPPKDVAAILIVLPGFTVGSNYLNFMAQNLVDISCGEIEVWTVDRRNHQMEDTWGMQAAEQELDPDIAYGYYYEGAQVDGRTFQGYPNAFDSGSAMMSEWGMDVLMKDIRTVIEQVPADKRKTNVFLGGHSRGAAHIKVFGAYQFEDGSMGADQVAGLAMLDGESRYIPIGEGLYKMGVLALRMGWLPRYYMVEPLGPALYHYMEILAMAGSDELADQGDPRLGPEGFYDKLGPARFFMPFLLRSTQIKMTNEAMFGFFFDKQTGPINLLHGNIGALDGPVDQDLLGTFPSDPDHIYRWLHYDQTDPLEFCEIQDMMHSYYKGPSHPTDPFYPTRLDLDFFAAGFLDLAGSWRENYFPVYNSQMDAPVYLLGSRVLSGLNRHEFYRAQLPPVRGQSTPRDQFGFDVLMMPEWEHIDTIYAVVEDNPFYPDFLGWMEKFAEGRVQVP